MGGPRRTSTARTLWLILLVRRIIICFVCTRLRNRGAWISLESWMIPSMPKCIVRKPDLRPCALRQRLLVNAPRTNKIRVDLIRLHVIYFLAAIRMGIRLAVASAGGGVSVLPLKYLNL